MRFEWGYCCQMDWGGGGWGGKSANRAQPEARTGSPRPVVIAPRVLASTRINKLEREKAGMGRGRQSKGNSEFKPGVLCIKCKRNSKCPLEGDVQIPLVHNDAFGPFRRPAT